MKKPTCECHKDRAWGNSSVHHASYVVIGTEIVLGGLTTLPVYAQLNFCPECGKPYKEETSGEEKEN